MNINSSGIYNVDAYNIISNNTTVLSSLNSNNFTSNNATIVSSLNVTGFTILNNYTTITAPINISTTQTTMPSALNINGSSFSVLCNIVQNMPLNPNVDNYAFNVTGFSNFGGILINGQDKNQIYNPSGDLNIGASSTNNILFKTNSGFWETMRVNPYGVSVNTSFYVSGNTILNNATSIFGTLNVSGPSTFYNNTTYISSLNVSGFTNLSNNTTLLSSLNVSGFTNLSNNTTLLSSLNISGRTIIGSNIYNYSDSVLEAYKNFSIRKNVSGLIGSGDRVELKVGLGTSQSYMSMEEGYDINLINSLGNISLYSLNTTANTTINLNAINTMVSNDLNVKGRVYASNIPSEIFNFSCSTTCTLNNATYYKYDIDLTKYTTSITNGTATLRKFKWMSWLYTGFHNAAQYSLNYDVDYAFVSNNLNVLAYGFPCNNYNLNSICSNGCFLFAHDYNTLTIFCTKNSNFQAIIIDYFS